MGGSTIVDDASYFDSMLRLIPEKYYLVDESQPKNARFLPKAEKQKLKQQRKQDARKKFVAHDEQDILQKQQAQLQREQKGKGAVKASKKGDASASGSIDELRNRLQSKIEEMRRKRKLDNGDESGGSKRARREQEKSKRREQRGKEHSDATSGKKHSGNLRKGNAEGEAATSNGSSEASKGNKRKIDLAFSAVKGIDEKPDYASDKKRMRKKDKLKDALRKVEGFERKVASLKETDKELAEELKKKKNWENVLGKASGEKIRDDVKLIKKSIKREEKKKQRSTKAWKDRLATQEQKTSAKQEKREANLKARVDRKKDKRLGIKPKKQKPKSSPKAAGKKRPGFEGKKKEFINKK